MPYTPPATTSTGKRHDATEGPFYVTSGCIVDGRGNLVATRYSWTRLDAETGETKEVRGREDAIDPCEADANCHLLAASWDMRQALLAMLAEHGGTYPDSPATAAARAALTRSYGFAYLSQRGKE